ncbi:hypothetical protein [Flavobacterium rhizosphaerae]|uniref:Uncharacterized protein n=1 Tax=Flavobacterium rhizosphaerae TaxID=3163298 RepID=A0ABW8YSW4_9FLAO
MKNVLFTSALLCAFLFTSCNDDDPISQAQFAPPTQQQFTSLKESAYNNIRQTFTVDASQYIMVTSQKGVTLSFALGSFTYNGSVVTGNVDIEFVEIFDRGTMLATGMSTMGLTNSAEKALIISGGEFYINATQNGHQLDAYFIELAVPCELTGGPDNEMGLWFGIEAESDIVWEEDDNVNGQKQGVWQKGGVYYAYFNQFGWTNVDRWYSDPRPKTTIQVGVPDGFDNTNSAVYLAYNDEDNALAVLDTYDAEKGLFSEHYGQTPIGLECSVIFVSENNGEWIYAIQSVTITENGIITFEDADLQTATEEELIVLINALP